MKILVIDDNQVNREAAVAQLGSTNKVTVAGSHDEAREILEGGCDFDAVLVDLIMPASGHRLSEEAKKKYEGNQMPNGVFLALLAAVKGAKMVALFSDSDHHSHPSAACIDSFNPHETNPMSFSVNDSKIIFSNTRCWVNYFYPNNLVKSYDYPKSGIMVRAKNWKLVLSHLNSC